MDNERSALDEVHIVEATQTHAFTEVPVAPFIADVQSEPTTVMPVQVVPVRTVQPDAYAPIPPVYIEERFIQDERRPAWPYIAAVVALLLGGLAGYLVGSSGTDEATPGAVTAPAGDTANPQLDEIIAIETAAATKNLQTQVEVLTVALDEARGLTDGLAGTVATLEVAVADLTVERDALAAQVAGNGGTNFDMQTQLDDANAQLATLTADLATARSELDTANASLRTAKSDLAAANAAYDALNVMPAPDYVDADIAQVRTEAAANGWTLVEQPINSTKVAAGTVLEQTPEAGTNMVKGSVLYVEVAKRP